MTSSDQLEMSPGQMEAAAVHLGNDAREARAVTELVDLLGQQWGQPDTGLSVRGELQNLGRAYAAGFTTVATELQDLAGQVSASARVVVLVDNNAAGYFTAADAI